MPFLFPRTSISVTALCLALPLAGVAAREDIRTIHYSDPVDAVSIGVPTDEIDLEVSAYVNGAWTLWQELEIEKEFDPLLKESNLVLFDAPTARVRVRGSTANYDVHPIRISQSPLKYSVAARRMVGMPSILKRSEWGADESLLVSSPATTRSDFNTIRADDSTPDRVRECLEAQRKYPAEFKTTRTVTHNAQGEEYSWAQRYSANIDLLVVHHTALKVTGDERSPVERMRALYQYHAMNRGWGDVGYHYIIDENGQVYEGRAGGDKVVGGHSYCSNVGTLGIALMGNFEVETPTQNQMIGLRWLLNNLARKHAIDVRDDTFFHGKRVKPILGHRDLVPTTCPGFYIEKTLSQIRSDVLAGRFYSPVQFPTMRFHDDQTHVRRTQRLIRQARQQGPTLSPVGTTALTGRPGGHVQFQLRLHTGDSAIPHRGRIALVERSHPRIGLWQMVDGRSVPVRKELISPIDLRVQSQHYIQLKVQLPSQARSYELQIGNITYTINTSGRRMRTEENAPTFQRNIVTLDSHQRQRARTANITPSNATADSLEPLENHKIRIRLSFEGDTAVITTNTLPLINGRYLGSRDVTLIKDNEVCLVESGGARLNAPVVRIDPTSGVSTITNWQSRSNIFRGVLECRIHDGKLTLINELPLEQYLYGLAEEPDSEPYEKQKAFAIAARSYAAFYLDPLHRKFPNKPYDGSDSPAEFQAYGGVNFENRNPRWVKAVKSTEDIVVSKNGQIVKTPYFSSDDGRTRSPSERGWNHFPFSEVFVSKPDPWCEGQPLRGHGVGMSGCGSEGQALEGRIARQILEYYYTGTKLVDLDDLDS